MLGKTIVIVILVTMLGYLFLFYFTFSRLVAGRPFTSLSHPAFPQYLMRIVEPETAICDASVKQYNGYLDTDNDKHFFFWFFESRNDPKNDPLILWLNGGPGCSSMTGLFLELGPCLMNEAGTDVNYNPYSWNSNASVIFLDQPINVGYSYGPEGVYDSATAAEDAYAFLQLFFNQFPEIGQQSTDLSISTLQENHANAGHYIPAIATRIAQGNQDSKNIPITIQSLLIGNGLVDPLIQYGKYSEMACQNTYGPVFSQQMCDAMQARYPTCRSLIQECYDKQDRDSCATATIECDAVYLQPYLRFGLDPYDVRKSCMDCNAEVDNLQAYLNRPELKQALGTQQVEFVGCNMRMNRMFQQQGDWMRPYVKDIPALLESGIRMLIYAGDADYICNWMGNKAWTLELPWSGQDDFVNAEDKEWMGAGQLRATPDGRFAFLRVYDAGHLVPEDKPEVALAFLNGWIHGGLLL